MPSQRSSAFTFWGTVTALWTALRLKKEWDEYSAVATDDVEGRGQAGRIHLPDTPLPRDDDPSQSEDAVSLLDTTVRVRRQKKKPAGCCMCCGIDCTLFWKAFGIVVALWSLYGVFKVAKWALTPSPTGLEGMPTFSKSLGCENNNFFYKEAATGITVNVPVNQRYGSHTVKLLGSAAVGTITIASASSSNTSEITHDVIIRGTDQKLVDGSEVNFDASTFGSRFNIDMPSIPRADLASGKKCVRFDVRINVPPTVKELYIQSHPATHVKFDESAQLDLKRLSVILFRLDSKNMILPSTGVHASDELYLEAYQGWIVGEATLAGSLNVVTQRSDGVANIKVHVAPPADIENPEPATLRTTTGSGRTDVVYIADKGPKRRIDSTHLSQRNGDVYLTYKKAHFNGKIAMSSKSSTIVGATPVEFSKRPSVPDGVAPRDEDDTVKWTHVRGNPEGKDRIVIESRGWTGLYF